MVEDRIMQTSSLKNLYLVLPFFHLLLCLHGIDAQSQKGNKTVPALIVFGDSIVDPGNNNVLKTLIKCDFPPYGQDFKQHMPTGRFSNGKIPSDLIGLMFHDSSMHASESLGIKDLLPAYYDPDLTPEDLLTGVSFASGGSGYDSLTPKLASAISLSDQLMLFEEYKEKIKAIAGEEKAARIVADSLYIIIIGTDDIANTYYSTPFRQAHYDLHSYVELLVNAASKFYLHFGLNDLVRPFDPIPGPLTISKVQGLRSLTSHVPGSPGPHPRRMQFKDLYKSGARKIGIVGLPPLGCVPSQRTLAGGLARDCAETHNHAAVAVNKRLSQEIDKLQSQLTDSLLVYIDAYTTLNDIIRHPSKYGFEVSTKGCCGTGLIEVVVLCNPLTPHTCTDVSKYVFWDSYHPTERAYRILFDKIAEEYLPLLTG
ncbi:hypothetical protein ACLOJK_025747 [Asimina triloba]